MIFGGKARRVQEHQQALAEARLLVRKYLTHESNGYPYFDESNWPLEMKEWFRDHLTNLASHVAMPERHVDWANLLGDGSTLSDLQETLHYVRLVDQGAVTSVARAAMRAQYFDEIFDTLGELLAKLPALKDSSDRNYWMWTVRDLVPRAAEALSWYSGGVEPTECKYTIRQAEWILGEATRHATAIQQSADQGPTGEESRCPQCGEVNKPAAKFCSECAHKF